MGQTVVGPSVIRQSSGCTTENRAEDGVRVWWEGELEMGHEDCCRFLMCPPLQRLTIARVLLVATRCADDSVSDFATAAREEAERRVAEPETTTSRKRSWDMLDAAIRALEVEARDAKMRLAATA